MADEPVLLSMIDMAMECLDDAELLLNEDRYRSAVTKSYYAMFHLSNALAFCDGKQFSRHSQVIGYFGNQYIRTNEIDRNWFSALNGASALRNKSDYLYGSVVTKPEAEQHYSNAVLFSKAILSYIFDKKCSSDVIKTILDERFI